MHESAYAWATRVLILEDCKGAHVIEAGALNVNGSVRGHVESLHPASYTGTDIREGPGVDRVAAAEDLPRLLGLVGADVVICTEMLEHAADWMAALDGMLRILLPGGILVLTTRSQGFGYHDYGGDYWRFSVPAMSDIMAHARLDVLELAADPQPRHPGVFVKARMPQVWSPPPGMLASWAQVEGVTAMTPP